MPTSTELKKEANKDPVADPYFVSVLYGDYGSRKTTTACSMIKEKGLLLSSDDSWKVLLNKRHKDIYDKVKITPLEGLSQLKHIDFSGYDTIIWDTLSQSIDNFLDLVYDQANWGGKFRERLQSRNPELQGVEALAPADYRVTRDTIRPILNKLFKETKAHIIFTSQMTEPMPGISQNQQKRPSIPAATFKIVGTRADIIANTRGTGTKFVADVTQSLTQLGKSRFEGIQGAMDLDNFINKYKEIVFK
jgi:AAA domain